MSTSESEIPKDGGRTPSQAWLSLVLIAMIAAVAWRAEVELHGWADLTWITYFHWAIPVGLALFLGWVAVFCDIVPGRKRLAFLVIAVLFGVLLYPLLELSLRAFFVRGPAFLQYQISYGLEGFPLLRRAVFFLYPAIPLFGLVLAWVFGRRPSPLRSVMVVGLFLVAEPVATLLLELTNHVGGANPLHAIKSGFVIPFQIIGLGLIFAPLPAWTEFSLFKKSSR